MSMSLEEELSALIDAERERPDADVDAVDRVWQGVQARLDGAPPPASVPPLGAAPSSGWGGLSIVAGVLAVLAVGGVVGASMLSPSAPAFEPLPPEPALRVVAAAPEVPSLRVEIEPPAEVEASEPEAAPVVKKPRGAATKKRGGSVADELILIERARKALDGGKAKAALGALSEHRREFPKGTFIEEATALRASALCKAGRTDDAKKLATKFLARWPRSVHAARVRTCSD